MLRTVEKHGRVLGAWHDLDLVQMRTAGFLTGEALHSAADKASGSYLWMLTSKGRDFLTAEGLSR
jgi:hypothetical protein